MNEKMISTANLTDMLMDCDERELRIMLAYLSTYVSQRVFTAAYTDAKAH